MAPVNAQRLMGRTSTVQSAAVAPQQQLVASPADTAVLKDISKSLTNIIQLLSQQNKQTAKDSDQNRKDQERSRRKGIELNLERSFATVKNVATAVIAPVKSILDQIIQFFVTIFLGRALILLLNWFSDENNRSKVRSIMRFLQDWWPSLVAGYILFGTGFGRIVRKVAGVAIGVTARLVVIAGRLAKAILTGQILKRKGIASVFAGGGKLGGLKGFALRGGIAAAATIGTGFAIDKMMGGGREQAPQLDVPEAPTSPAMGAFGGGFAGLKDLFSSATSGLSSKVNPFTAFFGSGGLASLMQGMNGVVSGPKGIDKVPAMLTDGEFVMSRGAVQKFGVNTLEAMNSAGGGTNQPKIIRGIPYAYGGGFIGDEDLYKQAAASSRPTGGSVGARKYTYDPNNPQHVANYEKLKRIVIKKGIYKPSFTTPTSSSSPNVNTKVNVNYEGSKPGSIIRTSPSSLSTEVKPPIQSIRTNMEVPGGKTGRGGLVGAIALTLAETFKPQIQSMVGGLYNNMGIGMGNLSDKELKRQLEEEKNIEKRIGSGPLGSTINAGSDRLSLLQQEFERRAESRLRGGKISGGYGLKKQSFKDMPKTQIMTDDKGRPFVGYKAIRNGKPVYVRGPKPGTGTSNPLEMVGRFLNPGSYTDNDARLAMKKQKVAMVNSLESLQERGASVETQKKMIRQMGGNLKDVQNDLTYRKKQARLKLSPVKPKSRGITPTPRPEPKVIKSKPQVAGSGMNGGRGSGSNPSVPKFSASSGGNNKNAKIYGIK